MYIGATIPMIKSGAFSQTSHMIQTLEGVGFMALRRWHRKFQNTPGKFDRDWS